MRAIEKYLEKYEVKNKKNYDKEEPRISEKFDKLSHEKVDKLYDVLLYKLSNIYKKRPANPKETLSSNCDIFRKSDNLYEKIKTVNEILNFLRCDGKISGNLEFINGKKNAGNMAINKNTVGKGKVTIINQSVTGLFENRQEI